MTEQDYVTVFYYGACVPVANGGNARLADLLDRLQGEFPRVALFSYADHPDFPWTASAETAFRARWPRIELVLERYGRLLRQATRCKNLLVSLVTPGTAHRVIRASVPRPSSRFAALRRRSGAFLISYAEGLTQVNGVDPARCVVETHDVNFIKWAKMHGRRPASWTALRKFRGEMTALGGVHAVVAISAGETAFFRMMLARPVCYVPRWSDAPPLSRPQGGATDFDLIFVGSNYVMNVRGFCAMLARDGSWLARYRIVVCGRVCESEAVREAARAFPNIRLLGFVDAVEDLYRRCRAALSPVDGTGTKMKVLAALAAGLPVFASSQSVEGLPAGHDGAVFPLTRDAVATVLGSEARERQARDAVERYDAALRATGDVAAALGALRSLVPTNIHPALAASPPGDASP